MKEACMQTEASAALEGYLDRIECLPPTPTILIKLIELFRQPEVDVDDIVQWLRRDPALAVEVLRRCNNSFFGENDTIQDVNEAVYRLGFYEVYQITVALFGMRALSAPKVVAGFPAEELRMHSHIAAIAAGALAREVGVSEGIAFTAALLHDVGKLVFALAEGLRYVEMMANCKRAGGPLSQCERESFGFNHSELGAQLLRRWGVPEEVVQPVLGHNDATQHGTIEHLTVITRYASQMANHIQSETKAPFSKTAEAERLMEFFKLETEQMEGWEHLVRSKVKQMRGGEIR